jgi:hypothetical protein
MNTRICTHAVVAKDAPPNENTPGAFHIEFDKPRQLNRLNRLKNCEIKSTKWAFPHILNQLGLRHNFDNLCNNVGLPHFVFQEAGTYRRSTLEFLSTLKHTVGSFHIPEEEQPRVGRISFRLMNRVLLDSG